MRSKDENCIYESMQHDSRIDRYYVLYQCSLWLNGLASSALLRALASCFDAFDAQQPARRVTYLLMPVCKLLLVPEYYLQNQHTLRAKVHVILVHWALVLFYSWLLALKSAWKLARYMHVQHVNSPSWQVRRWRSR